MRRKQATRLLNAYKIIISLYPKTQILPLPLYLMKGGECMIKTFLMSLIALAVAFAVTANIVMAQTSTTTPSPSPTNSATQNNTGNTNATPGAPNTGFGY